MNSKDYRKVLVIAAHADDESLGCGGTIARHVCHGDHVAVLFMTDGVGSRNSANAKEITVRRNAMDLALAVLGVRDHWLLDFPDNALDQVPLLQIAKAIENVARDWGSPDLVYTHHPGDLNIDHHLTHRAVLTCFRPQPTEGRITREILTFEVPSSTGWLGASAAKPFHPNYFVDISATLDIKLEALKAYETEMRPWPHARSQESIVHLAKFRGASVGLPAAEAFEVERIIRTTFDLESGG